STLWGEGDYKFIFYQLILALLTVSIPYLISKIVNDKHIDFHKLISNFALVLTIVLFFYMFELWRLEDGGRLTGALVTAAILSVIIIPTISVHLYNLMFRIRVLVSFLVFFISLIILFLTHSRVVVLILVIFVVFIMLLK